MIVYTDWAINSSPFYLFRSILSDRLFALKVCLSLHMIHDQIEFIPTTISPSPAFIFVSRDTRTITHGSKIHGVANRDHDRCGVKLEKSMDIAVDYQSQFQLIFLLSGLRNVNHFSCVYLLRHYGSWIVTCSKCIPRNIGEHDVSISYGPTVH